MRKASRLFEIIQILRLARKPVTAAQIAAQLEVTVRSIYRDIVALQAMRVPIEGGRGIGYILRPGFTLPPLMLTVDETEAIRAGAGASGADGRHGAPAGREAGEPQDRGRRAGTACRNFFRLRAPCLGKRRACPRSRGPGADPPRDPV
ncbi:putative DNA-binding transcriptional regulator YafY [Pseudorhizobium tarimense]|uniref:DNA-binding transcriptional regulator YafY n=1 Tax=Pseudorhizobium tarimense TaxID=1079109 RepID=A0ABV2H0J3_9HYPH